MSVRECSELRVSTSARPTCHLSGSVVAPLLLAAATLEASNDPGRRRRTPLLSRRSAGRSGRRDDAADLAVIPCGITTREGGRAVVAVEVGRVWPAPTRTSRAPPSASVGWWAQESVCPRESAIARPIA